MIFQEKEPIVIEAFENINLFPEIGLRNEYTKKGIIHFTTGLRSNNDYVIYTGLCL